MTRKQILSKTSQTLIEACKETGLQVNATKTKHMATDRDQVLLGGNIKVSNYTFDKVKGSIMINTNDIREETKRRLRSGNAHNFF